jgi:hypothetical protein
MILEVNKSHLTNFRKDFRLAIFVTFSLDLSTCCELAIMIRFPQIANPSSTHLDLAENLRKTATTNEFALDTDST